MDCDTETTEISSPLKDWAENQDYESIAGFFSSLVGSSEKARALLEQVLAVLPGDSRKRSAPPTTSEEPAVSSGRVFLLGDSLDEASVTCLVQLPKDSAVIAHVIGAQGKNIKHMTESTGCAINLDKKAQSAQSRSNVVTAFVQGPLRSVASATELLLKNVEMFSNQAKEGGGRPSWMDSGSGINRTVMLIPDELVKRVIGRSGVTVTKLQQDSGAAVQIQNEAKMKSAPDPLYGREVTLTGTLDTRTNALYRIARMLLQDQECPLSWKTPQQFPVPLRSGSVTVTVGGISNSSGRGVYGQPNVAPHNYSGPPSLSNYSPYASSHNVPPPPPPRPAGQGVAPGTNQYHAGVHVQQPQHQPPSSFASGGTRGVQAQTQAQQLQPQQLQPQQLQQQQQLHQQHLQQQQLQQRQQQQLQQQQPAHAHYYQR